MNKPRKPWLAGIFTLVSTGLGHIYTGKAKRGIVLFFIDQLVFIISTSLLILPIIPANIIIAFLILLIFKIFCIADAMNFAKISRQSYDLEKYNRWHIYLFVFIISSIAIRPIIAYGIKTNIVQAYDLPTLSMKPALLTGDRILVNKFIYKISDPKRGDIIVHPFPEDISKTFIKRIIGVGGDIIEIRDKQVFINDSEFKEVYKNTLDNRIISGKASPRDNFGPFKIPQDTLFVMGDNRDNSYDSRFWGVIKKTEAQGKAISIYWSWDKEKLQTRWDRIGNKIR